MILEESNVLSDILINQGRIHNIIITQGVFPQAIGVKIISKILLMNGKIVLIKVWIVITSFLKIIQKLVVINFKILPPNWFTIEEANQNLKNYLIITM